MGMIKADDIQTLIPRSPLDSDKVQRGNSVAVARRIHMGIRAGDNSGNRILRISKMAEQDAATLVRIRLFGMAAKSGVAGGINP